MIKGTIEGRAFTLDYSSGSLKAEFMSADDRKFLLEFSTVAIHPVEGLGVYAVKDSLIGAQACIDELIAMEIDIVIEEGKAPLNGDVIVE